MLWLVKKRTELESSPARHDLIEWALSAKQDKGLYLRNYAKILHHKSSYRTGFSKHYN
jgi:hypothetical protein